jgi:3-(3-hydroxy-phenyl)propionate hydroxylase
MRSHIQKQEGAGFMDVTGVADQTRYDVLIVGFGPVGAVAANLLGQAGVRVLVIEKTPDIFPKPIAPICARS